QDLRISHNESVIRQRKSRNREMIRLAANGMSYREIGEKFGLKPATVGQIVRELRPTDFVPKEKKRNSIKSSQSGKSKLSIKDQGFSTIQERNAAIMHLNQDGYSHREIGEQMGLKRDTIKKIVQNMRKNS
ncbi:helix-turn-helix domain-containing protein, partial [Corynebacterium casei]|uniref:helix-turn-helix domain-containing protein n=1 Tax=Corynebacterium casei TaxID=160386 RepID=UPI003FD1BE5A